MGSLHNFRKFTDRLPLQGNTMPVLFTSHGNPMDIPVPRTEKLFWNALYELGESLKSRFEIRAALVVSAHWCTSNQTFVNISPEQQQIYDYYGFPKHYYDPVYQAKGAPEIAEEVTKIVSSVKPTTDWGLDHGAWPMLMHLFPDATIPVFQMSIDYYASPEYHYNLGKELKVLREKGVLIIGSGAMIHNLNQAMGKFQRGDMSLMGWEEEYDSWIKDQLDQRNIKNIINYKTSHQLGQLAAPTPDHFVPVLYSLGMMDKKDDLQFFYDHAPTIPAFGERSFILGNF